MLYLKAIHIVFVIAWFAGLFYMPRLLIYSREAQDFDETKRNILTEQYLLMATRLLNIITIPASIFTFFVGLILLHYYPVWPIWLKLKLLFVLGLYAYQISLYILLKKQKSGIFNWTSGQLRLYNEIPTVLLVAIVFLVVVRQNLAALQGIVGLFVLIAVLMFGVKLYQHFRHEK